MRRCSLSFFTSNWPICIIVRLVIDGRDRLTFGKLSVDIRARNFTGMLTARRPWECRTNVSKYLDDIS